MNDTNNPPEPKLLPLPMPPPQEKPRWSPLIVPQPASAPVPEEEREEESWTEIRPRPELIRHSYKSDGRLEQLDTLRGAELLRTALVELGMVRRRYAHLEPLATVWSAIDALADQVLAPEAARVRDAVRYGRTLMAREGLDVQTAAAQAAAIHGVDRWALLGLLRQGEVA